MPRLLLEGKSITELLARVRDEHGPDVRIVSADRVRSGGIGGFFARESYALTVELGEEALAAGGIDEPPTFRIPPTVPSPRGAADVRAPGDPHAPGTLLDLAAAIDAAEAAETGVVLGTTSMHATSAGTPVAATRPAPALSTTGAGFAEILARLAALEAAEAASQNITPAEPTPPGPLALDAAGWQRLSGLLHELCGLDLPAESGPLVLVIAPPVLASAPIPARTIEVPPPPTQAAIPRQGRHRRSAVDEAVAVAIAAN